MLRTGFLIALTACALLTLGSLARSDVVHLVGGGEVEGEILKEDADGVRIKTRFGTMDIPRSRIEKVVRAKSIRRQLADRHAALADDDAEGRFQLAEWAKKNSLEKEALALYQEAARIDPLHKGANEALGRVPFEGRYVTPEEKDRILAEREDATMAEKGLVRYKDRWVTPEEKDALERGLVKGPGGRWITQEEAMRAKGFVRYKGEWIKKEELEGRKDLDRFQAIVRGKLSVLDTKHFRFFSVYTDEETRRIADACEKTYEDFLGVFALPADERLFHRGKCRVLLFQKSDMFDRFLRWFGKEMGFEDARIRLIQQHRGTYEIYPEPYIAGYQFPDPFEHLMGRTIHKLSHILVHGWKFDGKWLPWWITEGLGSFSEINALGRCDTYCITIRGYGNARDNQAEKWHDSTDWKQKLKQAVTGRRDPLLTQMKVKDLNDLDHVDVAKAWSIMEWMIRHHRERLIEFIRGMKKGMSQDDAMKAAFGREWGALDKEWKEYVLSNY